MSLLFHFTNPSNLVGGCPIVVSSYAEMNFQERQERLEVLSGGLTSGRVLNASGRIRLRVIRGSSPFPDAFFSGEAWMRSQVAERVAAAFPDEVQLFPVTSIESPELNDYLAVNFTKLVDCIDFHRSSYRQHSSGRAICYVFFRMAFDEGRIPYQAGIFRPLHATSYLLVTEEARITLSKIGFADDWFRHPVGLESELS